MPNKFDTWLGNASPGSEMIYHTGKSLSKHGEGLEFTDLTHSAREAFERGEVDLVQRRLSKGKTVKSIGRFAWIAIKRKDVRRPRLWVSKEGVPVDWVKRPERRSARRG